MSRPSFITAWAASQRIYDLVNSGARVGKVIGGNIEKGINHSTAEQRWNNTCAVRMSYILGEAGLMIPNILGQTVPGADGRKYFFRVWDLIGFLKQQWGKAEVVKYPVSGSGTLVGKKGLILFEVSNWSDAQGMPRFSTANPATTTVISMSRRRNIARTMRTSGACGEVDPVVPGTGDLHIAVIHSPRL